MDVTVEIAQGRLRGQRVDAVTSFLGIPYAEAPFGPNRFAAPTPPPRWAGVRDAVAYGATAPKIGYRPPISDILSEPVVPAPTAVASLASVATSMSLCPGWVYL